MTFRGLSIQRKIMAAIMVTSMVLVGLVTVAFATYDLITFRQALVRNLATLAKVIADNSTGALVFDVESEARDALFALKADQHIEVACLYTRDGKVYAKYPSMAAEVPDRPGADGYGFAAGHLERVEPVILKNNRWGTLYLRSDLTALSDRLRLYAVIALVVMIASLAVAFGLSNALQKRISQPILSLAGAAREISEKQDYSVRVGKQSEDELGLLTDAFNQMLTRIQEQTVALRENEERLRLSLEASQTGTWDWNIAANTIQWDERLHLLFGLRPGTFGGTYKHFLDLIHPEERDSVAYTIAQALDQKREFRAEFRVVWPNASVHHMFSRGKALYDENKPVRMTGVTMDITERKGAEEARALLAAIVESSNDSIISMDLTGGIITWNKGSERLFGYTAEEVVGRPITIIVPPDRVEEETKFQERIRRGKSVTHFETVRVRKDGALLDISLTVSPIRDSQGKIIGASKIVRDITQRKRAEEKMAWLASFPEDNPNPVVELDLARGVIHYVNPYAARLFPDLQSQGLRHPWLAGVQDAARPLLEGKTGAVRREIAVGKFFYAQTIGYVPEARRMRLYSTDITERRQAEERAAAFARLAQSLSAITTPAGAARVIATAADQLIGWDACSLDVYSAEADLIYPVINIDTIEGKRVDVPPAYSGKPPSAVVRRVLEQGGQLVLRHEPYDFSQEAIPFGNTSLPSASLLYVPVRRGEKTIGILSIQSYTPDAYNQHDLTALQTLADQCSAALERVRAEEELRQLNEKLEQHVRDRTAQLEAANKDLEAFTYSVAHDLRAPLRHMDAYAKMLRDDFASSLPPEANRYVESIRRGSHNMSRLVDDLLNLARVGRREVKAEPTSLDTLVEAAKADLTGEAGNRQIDWRIGPLGAAECDPGLMKQVFVNLLSNAVKYTRPRPVAVIEIGRTDLNGQTNIFVRDNGVGFNMKYADKLFGVFQRLHRAEDFEGTGVGLATVERIIRKHGGHIRAESAVDQGTTFYFTINRLDKVTATG